jgi:hypothetical protein
MGTRRRGGLHVAHTIPAGARRAGLLIALVIGLLAAPATGASAQTDDFEVEVQYPFVCTTARYGLGQPIIDNQAQQGIPVAQEDEAGRLPEGRPGLPDGEATIIGWSRDCEVDPQHHYLYRNAEGAWTRVERLADVPAEGVATTTTTEGQTVPLIARMERGTINRFIYSVAMLVPAGRPTRPSRTRRCGTGGSCTASRAAWRSATPRARGRSQRRCSRTRWCRATPSSTPPAPARTPTTTCGAAARRR